MNTRNERLLLKRGRRLFLWHQFCCHTDEFRNGYGITFDAIDEKWLHFGATSSPAQENGSNLEPRQKIFSRGLIFRLFRCLPSEGINIFSSDLIFGLSRDLPLEGRKVSKGHGERIFRQDPKNAPLSFLTLWGYVPGQLNSRYRDRYDCATTAKERARQRRGDPGAGI